ncbi:Nucleoid-associated protein YejK [Serratia plymuthica]|nr:Nucleoid-associated protein YejK [Serratia plymuthica]
MSFKLKHCVIHELKKEAGKQKVEVDLKEVALPNNDESVVKLVQSLCELIGKRDNQAARGTFDEDDKIYKVPSEFHRYYESKLEVENFIAFTKVCMHELSKQAKDASRVAASGGAIVFSHYLSNNSHYFLVTMIKQKDALRLNADLKPVGTVQIDLLKIHQAARLNFDRYYNYQIADELDKTNYLAFVSPKINQDASGYFVAALGCTDSVPTARATDAALSGVRAFFEASKELVAYKSPAYDAVLHYMKEKPKGEPARLTEIEHIVRGVVPAKFNAYLDNIVDFLNSEEIGLPHEFGINESVLNRRSRVRTKTDGWELVFERRVLGTTIGSGIQYLKGEGKLIISNLDDATIKKIEKALEEK